MASLVGQHLGEYLLETEIGRGSMGVVYRAVHVASGSECAVKVLLETLSADQSFVTRFTQEADVVRKLNHENIIRVYHLGQQGEQLLYFVMEYFPGATAGQLLKQYGRLSAGQVVGIALQTADALAYAHANGHLVHRDIKPENLLVGEHWKVKVLDFGLARIEGAKSITSAGTVVGSLYYVSPEQLRGRKLDGRTDVYALGVSMYEMLCGKRPFLGQSFSELSSIILAGNCVPLGQLEPSIPIELERIVARAMARDLDERYASAAELWHDLRAVQSSVSSSSSLSAHPVNPAYPADPANRWPAPSPKVTLVKPPYPGAQPRRTLRPASLVPAPPESNPNASPKSNDASPRAPGGQHSPDRDRRDQDERDSAGDGGLPPLGWDE